MTEDIKEVDDKVLALSLLNSIYLDGTINVALLDKNLSCSAIDLSNTVLVKVTSRLDELLPQEIGLGDLSKFITMINWFDELPSFGISDNQLSIDKGTSNFKISIQDKEFIATTPDGDPLGTILKGYESNDKHTLHKSFIQKIISLGNMFNGEYIVFSSDGKTITCALQSSGTDKNSFKTEVGSVSDGEKFEVKYSFDLFLKVIRQYVNLAEAEFMEVSFKDSYPMSFIINQEKFDVVWCIAPAEES